MQVLIPKSIFTNESLLMVSILFKSLYGKGTELRVFQIKDTLQEFLVVNVEESRGKQVAVNYVKDLGLPSGFFIKNGWLMEKWSDTGIVDKLGPVTEINGVIKLRGV